MTNEMIISESQSLYSDIDCCITELLKARTEHNSENEGKALFKMESLMVSTLQHLACIIEQPSLPSNLDEAADRFAIIYDQGTCDGIAQDCFKAGAEWMAGQGETKEGFVAAYSNGTYRVYTTILEENSKIKFGDNVVLPKEKITHIRKGFNE